MSSLVSAVTLPPPFGGLTDGSVTSLGLNDAQARGSLYLVEDFSQSLTGGYVTSVASGTSNYAGGGRGNVALTQSDLANHPGLACALTVGTGYAGIGAMSQGVSVWGQSGVTTTWSACFRAPTLVSTDTDAYTFFVGFFGLVAAQYTGDGPGFAYTHNVNGGAYRVFTANPSNQLPTYTNTSIAFVPASWHNIRVVLSAKTWQFYFDDQLVATTVDPSFNANNAFACSLGTILMARTASAASSPPYCSALIDRASVYAAGLAR